MSGKTGEQPDDKKPSVGARFNRITFVCSYPKSGNTWVRSLLTEYYNHPQKRFYEMSDTAASPYQMVSSVPTTEFTLQDQAQLRPAAMQVIQSWMPQREALVKSHDGAYRIFNIPLFSPLWTERVLYIVRDPRDVCCSWANHLGQSYQETAEFMVNDNARVGAQDGLGHITRSWRDHVLSWRQNLEQNDALDIFMTSYEALHEDTEGVFRDILAWMGEEDIDEDRLRKALRATEFDRMSGIEKERGFDEATRHQKGDDGEGFFRKGEAGGWRDELPEQPKKLLEDKLEDAMTAFNYPVADILT